jgi:hypothetical protein
MTKIIIGRKMSGTGSIYDLASQNEIVINVGRYAFAVVGPSYYNLTASRHLSDTAAINAAKKLTSEGYDGIKVLGVDGIQYHTEKWLDELIPEDSAEFRVE